eukprot:TRINITY_DN2777_c0_g1_i1.p1 TRINITY_DN2777_c0_g1~~TRINITY_DN2777_c0_g1_i1.p1  ORF type:complete len:299 (+),score=43.42 TRINITY_DN2777_c0_g1_i1:116-1012(+)
MVVGSSYNTLADLKLCFVTQELGKATQGLHDTIARHKRAKEQRRLDEERSKIRQQRHEASRVRRRIEVAACIRIQRAWRNTVIYRRSTAPLMSKLKRKLLVDTKRKLKESLVDLRCNVHDLHTLPEDQQWAAMKLQTWWRAVLSNRVQAVMGMFDKVVEVRNRMICAATIIQSAFRAKKAIRRVDVLRDERRLHELEQARLYEELRLKSVITIQSAYRKRSAVKEVQSRRAMMFAAVLSHGNEDNSYRLADTVAAQRSERKAVQNFFSGHAPTGTRPTKGGTAAKGTPRRKRPVTDRN